MNRHLIAGWSTGFGAILLGVSTTMLGILLLEGFVRGMLIGIGIVLTITGTVLLAGTLGWLSSHNRSSESDGWWLPSRDDER
ncbi:hypothetical protein [Agromyces laixinhei]|nr:hypothetical protein [Agromyces laixinhei]